MKNIARILASLLTLACAHAVPHDGFVLASNTFNDGGTLPDSTVLNALDCHGPDISPLTGLPPRRRAS